MVYPHIKELKEEAEEKNNEMDITSQILAEFNEKLYKKFKYDEFNESRFILNKSPCTQNFGQFSPQGNHTRNSSLFSCKSLKKVNFNTPSTNTLRVMMFLITTSRLTQSIQVFLVEQRVV